MLVERLTLLPAGTTSNEALHAEINNWFRQTQVRISEDTHTLVNPSLKPYFIILIGETILWRFMILVSLNDTLTVPS
jgi:hypothetical protein